VKIIKNENVLAVDIDETLIVSTTDKSLKTRPIWDAVTESFIMVQPHMPHVRLLLEEKQRGRFIIVWSRGGHAWAEAVVKGLGLLTSVDLIMSKPYAYVDDTPVQEWLAERVFIPHTTNYKGVLS
jgi:hypothetical protein